MQYLKSYGRRIVCDLYLIFVIATLSFFAGFFFHLGYLASYVSPVKMLVVKYFDGFN